MPMFSMAKNWKDRGLQIQALKGKCNHILAKLSLPNEDARAEGIVHLRQLCNTLAAVPIKLQQNAERPVNVRIIMQLLGLQRPEDLQACLSDFNKNSKASFITMAQFALENCISHILDAIPGEREQGAFSRSSLRLLKVTGVPHHQAKHEILMVPAWIRNALHSAGIHNRATKTVVVDGESFRFEKGKRLSCASWGHLVHCLSSALDIYEEMLCSSLVKSIPNVPIVS
jgi:hypothetical protein